MANLILEAIHYMSKIYKRKVTEDSISTYRKNKGAHNGDNKSVIEILKQLPGKGLINQLYRPTDTAITSKAPHSIPSQYVISPIAENHVNKPIPSINRSLMTAMTGINTTPRALTMENSSLNV